MYLHFAARSFLYRHRVIGALYAVPLLRRFVRTFFFRFTEYVPIAYVELTSICNAACIFCPYPAIVGSGKAVRKMPSAMFEHVVARLAEERVAYVNLTPTTGELLGNPAWAEAIDTIAALPSVKRVHFYTNAILLREAQIQKLFSLQHFDKLVISISTGGIDRSSYAELFGVDRFSRVQQNIQMLMRRLGEVHASIPVSVEVRLTRHQKSIGIAQARAVYRTDLYEHSGINIRRVFDPIGGLVNDERLEFYQPIDKKDRPCQLLGDTRFAADGTVWACGCAVSEQPGENDLMLGEVNHRAEDLATQRRAIFDAWRNHQVVPPACRTCANYYLPLRGWPDGMRPMFSPENSI